MAIYSAQLAPTAPAPTTVTFIFFYFNDSTKYNKLSDEQKELRPDLLTKILPEWT
ncbi:hypothetical protein EZBTHKR_1432 [Elizabethkingia anophelis]|nr:hypothetical protein EZBTHKR_1432 [Elizabethkingia anophelis]